MTHYLLVGFVITTSFIHLCPGCSPAYPWNSLTFLERASRADTIVNGVVTNLFPIPEHPTSFPEAYVAEFETDCIFRGTTIRKYVNITNMGYLTSCSRTLVDNGTEYIILLRMNDAGELEPDEINIQTAAFVADEEHWSDLGVLCNITAAPPVGEQSCSPNVESKHIQVVDGCYSGTMSTYLGHNVIFLLISFILNTVNMQLNIT